MVWPMSREHPDDLLEAYAFGDCSSPDVGPHVADCDKCAELVEVARKSAGWLAVSQLAPPPAGLRERVLTAARSVRAPVSTSAVLAYVSQAAEMGALLDSLTPAPWRAPTVDGRRVRDLVLHLAGNDGNVLADLGTPVAATGDARRTWRDRSDGLLRIGDTLLAHPVRLAGKVPIRRPLREALTQRAFETWIHQDDIHAAIALPPVVPEPAHLARILGFGLALLPGAMDAAGRGRPGTSVRLVLTGPGGDQHLMALSARGPGDSPPVAEVEMPADRFGRLLAGRVEVTGSVAVITGDRPAALDLLAVAATMGCE